MKTPCAHCRKPVDFEPAKCPYCTVVQPVRSFDPARHHRLTAASALIGVLLGVGGAHVPPPPTHRVYKPHRESAKADIERDRVRYNWRQTKARLKPHGYRTVDPNALAVSPQDFRGKTLVLAGYATFMELRGDVAHFCLGTQWAGGRFFEVDVGSLGPKSRAMLLRAPMRPSLVAAWGAWADLPPLFAGINSADGSGLKAHGVEFLGPAPRGAAGDAQEILGD